MKSLIDEMRPTALTSIYLWDHTKKQLRWNVIGNVEGIFLFQLRDMLYTELATPLGHHLEIPFGTLTNNI